MIRLLAARCRHRPRAGRPRRRRGRRGRDRRRASRAAQILLLLHLPPDHFRPDGNYAGSYGDSFGRSARRRIADAARRTSMACGWSSDWPMPLLGVDCYVMAVPGPADGRAAGAQALSLDRRVAWAQTLNVYRARGHDDPLYSRCSRRRWRGGCRSCTKAPPAANVRVAVIDSGVEASHPDLVGQVAASRNFVERRPRRCRRGAWHRRRRHHRRARRQRRRHRRRGAASAPAGLRACWQEPASGTRCDSAQPGEGAARTRSTSARTVINLSLSGPAGPAARPAARRGARARHRRRREPPTRACPTAAFRPRIRASSACSTGPDAAPPGAGAAVARPATTCRPRGPARAGTVVSGASYAAAHVTGLLALLRELGARRGGTRDAAGRRHRRLRHAGARRRCRARCAAPLARH